MAIFENDDHQACRIHRIDSRVDEQPNVVMIVKDVVKGEPALRGHVKFMGRLHARNGMR